MSIDLKGLDKAAVLAALYNASQPQGRGFFAYKSEPMSVEEAQKHLERTQDFDYLNGRVMKVDLSGDVLDEWLYDRDNGQGAAEAAISSLRATANVNNADIRRSHADRTISSAQRLQSHIGESSSLDTEGEIPTVTLSYDNDQELKQKAAKAKEINKKRR